MDTSEKKLSAATLPLELDLESSDEENIFVEVQDFFNRRYLETVHDVHFAAYMLNPRQFVHAAETDIRLSGDERNRGMSFIEENLPINFLSTFLKFQAKMPPFRKSLFSKELIVSMSSAEWWFAFAAIEPDVISPPTLQEIIGLLTGVASSSGIERLFSRFGLVHNKLRNRLGVEKAAKLVTVYQSLNSGAAEKKKEESDSDSDDNHTKN